MQNIGLRKYGTLFLFGVLLVLSACGGQRYATGTLPEIGSPEAAVQLPETPYRLGPGDRIRVVVFRHEDLSGEFQLDGSGSFSMPLINSVSANGLTGPELEKEIERRLGDGYLVNPEVSVEVLTYRPFYILGEVNRPGQYEYESGMTVLNAIALAGGFTYRADTDEILLQRGGSNAEPVIVPGNTRVQPGDIITVQERFF